MDRLKSEKILCAQEKDKNYSMERQINIYSINKRALQLIKELSN